jgi:phasin family protein
MADTKTDNAPAKTADNAAKALERAADAAPRAAEKAAPAEMKDVAKATAQLATAPAKAMAKAAQEPAAKRAAPARRKPAARKAAATATARKAAPSRRKAAPAAANADAPKRAPARAAAARTATRTANTTTVNAKNMNEGTRNMKNEAKQAADRFQAVFGDVNERAKGAFERNARVAEELTELTKGNVEAMVASTKAAAKGVEALGQEVAEFSRKSFEDASAALKGFADVKSPTDFFRLQSDFARSQFDMMVAETSRFSEVALKVAGDVAQPITSRYSVAAERVRTAVA